jgi:uncharacterized protein (DUF1697 family)
MKYVALLRAINVGGRNLIRMSDVRTCLEAREFQQVSTYIQSGNVLFDSDATDVAELTSAIEKAFLEAFGTAVPVFLRSHRQMKTIVTAAPREWNNGAALRRNVAFLRKPLTSSKAVAEMDPKPAVDSVKAGEGVVYMTTVMARLKQSGLPKIVGKPIYRNMTIRSFTTCQKLLELLGRNSS